MHPSSLAAMRAPICAALIFVGGCGSTPKNEPPEPVGPTSQVTGRKAPVEPPAAPAEASPVPSTPAQPADIEAALAYDDADPLGNLEAADALDRMGKMEPLPNTPAPKKGCVVLDPGRRVWATPGPVSIASLGRGFAGAGYAK
jgi:hypothetical protein